MDDINPEFERWLAKATFPDGATPVSANIKLLMRMAYEAAALLSSESAVALNVDECHVAENEG